MWVKICGNTNLEDTLLAAELGADALGFVFAPSVRQVTLDQVAAINPYLPSHVQRVGVFPAWSAERIVAAVQQAGLTAVQLHGDYDPTLVNALRSSLPSGTILIQAVHWAVDLEEEDALALTKRVKSIARTGEVDYVLVDSKVGSATGGTGISFDWNTAQTFFSAHPDLILAGGLNPQNVHDAFKKLRPWGVDVASGVEAVAGRKDPEKLKQFIAEAKRL